MIYGVGPSGLMSNVPQQHYTIVGNSPPTGSSPQFHRQAMQCGTNGQPAPGGIVASPPGAPSPYFGIPPNYLPQNMVSTAETGQLIKQGVQMISGGSVINTQLAPEEAPKKRKRISKKQQQKVFLVYFFIIKLHFCRKNANVNSSNYVFKSSNNNMQWLHFVIINRWHLCNNNSSSREWLLQVYSNKCVGCLKPCNHVKCHLLNHNNIINNNKWLVFYQLYYYFS
jgi:hypothetical protein